MTFIQRCMWCRARCAEGSASIPNTIAGEARRKHAKYQIETTGSTLAFNSMFTDVCGDCANAVRFAIVEVYLERRKSAPEYTEQLEELEEKARELEAEKVRANADFEKLRSSAAATQEVLEKEAAKLRRELDAQKLLIKKSAALLAFNVEKMLAEEAEASAEAEAAEAEGTGAELEFDGMGQR